MYRSHLVVSLMVMCSAAGGFVAPPEQAGGDGEAAPPPPQTVERTIVRFAADGTFEQTFDTVTVDQQQAEVAARTAFLAGRHGQTTADLATLGIGGCAASDLWLFDNTSDTGNELCLFRHAADDAAWLDLGTVCRGFLCLSTWSNAVRSLYSGADPGSLQSCTSSLCYTTPFVSFNAYQNITSVGAGGTHPLNWAFLFQP